MNLEFGLTDDFTNMQFASLDAPSAYYQQHQLLAALEQVDLEMNIPDTSRLCKLKQVLVSILAGCETLTAFNTQ